jgi:hypothetical protein
MMLGRFSETVLSIRGQRGTGAMARRLALLEWLPGVVSGQISQTGDLKR